MKKSALFILFAAGIIFYGCAGNQSGGSNSIDPSSLAAYIMNLGPALEPKMGNQQITIPLSEPDETETSFFIKLAKFLLNLIGHKGASSSTDDDEALIKKYEADLAKNPQDYDACIMLASLYINRGNSGDADAAIKYSNQALAIRNDDTNALYARGLAYFNKGGYASQAMDDLNAVLKADIRHIKGVYYTMGLIYYADNNLDKAIGAIEKVKTIDPEYLDTNTILEMLYSKQNGN